MYCVATTIASSWLFIVHKAALVRVMDSIDDTEAIRALRRSLFVAFYSRKNKRH